MHLIAFGAIVSIIAALLSIASVALKALPPNELA
jgi:hypothetical protein